MDAREYDHMAEVEQRHWWFRGRLAVVRAMLRRYVQAGSRGLDCSSGTGMTLRELPEHVQIGIDLSDQALKHCRASGLRKLVRADLVRLPVADSSVGLVTCLDTLEHIEDDGAALGEICRVLRPGGQVLFTVPAHPFMFSAHDRALHHVRRYRKHELRERIQAAGFEIKRLSYMNFALFVPVALVRMLRRDRGDARSDTQGVPVSPVNTLLRWLFSLDACLLPIMNLPWGISLLVVARKPAPKTAVSM